VDAVTLEDARKAAQRLWGQGLLTVIVGSSPLAAAQSTTAPSATTPPPAAVQPGAAPSAATPATPN
ncbi:insulinase family protein, partial [Bradyrhizobium sp. CSA112]|nr:insulinase family protein [Bradyrhizobium sp. CSA112]